MLSTQEFADFGKEAVLFLHVTSQTDDEPHPNLLSEKGGRGFPYFAIMDDEGAVIGNPKGRSVDAFRAGVADSGSYLELKRKAESGDATAMTDLYLKRLEMGGIDYDAAIAARKELKKVSKEQNAKIDELLINLEYQSIRNTIRSARDVPDAGKKMVAMKDAGRIPSGRTEIDFWSILAFYAEQQKDAALFEAAYDALKDNADFPQRSKDQLKKRLERLQDGA